MLFKFSWFRLEEGKLQMVMSLDSTAFALILHFVVDDLYLQYVTTSTPYHSKKKHYTTNIGLNDRLLAFTNEIMYIHGGYITGK